MSSNDDFLFGGGAVSAKFDAIGDSITGTFVEDRVTQQTDFKTGKPKFWDDGNPINQLVVTLQTELRDSPDDDGKRNLYVKGSKKPGSQSLHDAVATAVKASGAEGLQVGGTLTVTHIGTEPTDAGSPRKLYSATYQPPSASFLSEQSAWPTAAPEPAQAPAPAAAAPAVASGPTPEQIAALKAAGVDPATVYPSLAGATQ